MDNKELNKLEALAKAATPGPWLARNDERENDSAEYWSIASPHGEVVGEEGIWWEPKEGTNRGNAEFIAAANPAAILELIALARAGSAAPAAPTKFRESYIDDMEDTLSQIGALVGVSNDADALIAAVKALAAPTAAEGPSYPAVKLTRDTMGMCVVSLELDGKWVPVLKDNGDFISHIVEPIGVAAAVAKSALICDTCGADRLKERCKAEHWQRCPMVGAAMSAAQAQPKDTTKGQA